MYILTQLGTILIGGCLKPFSLPSGKKILLYEDDVRNLIQAKPQERVPNE